MWLLLRSELRIQYVTLGKSLDFLVLQSTQNGEVKVEGKDRPNAGP